MTMQKIKGRGANYNPKNRFEQTHYELLDEAVEEQHSTKIVTQYFLDTSKTILAKNSSPDIPFTYDINPYRGCEHGCIYCYARPSHEYLGFSAGLDFETKIMVKKNAHVLLEKELKKKSWKPQVISIGGNTDCYQPIERTFEITRKILYVLLKYKNPFGIITKSALITRDIDILSELAQQHLAVATISITTLDKNLQSKMEPRTAQPELRLKTLEELAKAGIPVSVNVAPIIPGLNDSEIPAILKRASEFGAQRASWIMLRLPFAVKDMFVQWIEREFPEKAHKVLNRIRDVRNGELTNSQFTERMKGTGEVAESIAQLFALSVAKYGLNTERFHLSREKFQNDNSHTDQLTLF